MMRKDDGTQLVQDLEVLGRKLQEAGKALVRGTGDVMAAAAADTIVVADDALVAAHKQLAKVKAELKRRAAAGHVKH
jgi:hypothetical protein